MDLTPEQIEMIVSAVMNKLEPKTKASITKMIEDLDLPDTRNMASKKYVNDAIAEGIKPVTEELTKTNEQVTKIASDTDVKIKELATKSSWSRMFRTILDKDE